MKLHCTFTPKKKILVQWKESNFSFTNLKRKKNATVVYVWKGKMEETIKKWWKSPREFSGAFAGVTTVRNALKFEKGVDISHHKLINILHQIPQYIMKVKIFNSVLRTMKNKELLYYRSDNTRDFQEGPLMYEAVS